ncbi:MAG: DNA repair protein [Leptospiraceae bacterium]|nr:DNA repair protein [Leptospiraceae bacterium]
MKQKPFSGRISHLDPRGLALSTPEKMEDWEVLAVILGSGCKNKPVDVLSKELLVEYKNLLGVFLAPASVLDQKFGMGRAKTSLFSAIRELILRIRVLEAFQRSTETNLSHILEILKLKTQLETRECFFLISFGPQKQLLRIELLARGNLMEVGVHFRDVAKILLEDGATEAIIAHNHPNQTSQPSQEDIELFWNLHELLLPLEIVLLDHLVIGIDGVYSIQRKSLL